MTLDRKLTQQEKIERERWKKRRAALEWQDYVSWRRGTDGYWIYKFKHKAILLLGSLLKAVGLFKYGYRNAQRIGTRYVEIFPKSLPDAFKGYRILHLSDLHLDSIEGLGSRIAKIVASLSYDLCVISGDFRYARHGAFKQVLPPLRRIADAASASDGIYAVLGNHDTQAMSEDIEDLGIRLLTNQSVTIARGMAQLNLIGVDDPHDYYSKETAVCVKTRRNGFNLLLAHTPELYHLAATNNIHLYLCGHSHGGQICLPGGVPLMTYLNTGKRFYSGVWKYRDMIGHTSPGCGTAKIPIRFNCDPEITLLTLK